MPSGNVDQESSTSCEPNSSPYVDPIERGVVIDVPTIHHSQPLTVRLPEEMLRDGGEVTLRLTGGNLTVSKTNASEVKAKRKHGKSSLNSTVLILTLFVPGTEVPLGKLRT